MVANCASSRGHIGLTAAPPCGGGGAPGPACAWASTPSTVAASNTAQAKIRLEIDLVGEKIKDSDISGHEGDSARASRKPQARPTGPSHTRFSGQRHVVSGAPVW